MKVLSAWDCIEIALEESGNQKITVVDLARWAQGYREKHTEVFTNISMTMIMSEQERKLIYVEILDNAPNMIHLQETILCPICDELHYKFPRVDQFNKIKTLTEKYESNSNS